MNSIFNYLSKNFLSAVLMTVLTGLTVTTSAAGTAKLLGSINTFKPEVPEVRDVSSVDASEKSKVETSGKSSTTQAKSSNGISNTVGTLAKKLIAAISPTITPTGNGSSTQNNNSCIITLFGKQYDVFLLRSSHPGGDIFKCNTDMTSVYESQHGTNTSRMQKYLVTSTGTTNSTGSNSGSASFSESSSTVIKKDGSREVQEDDDDREDHNVDREDDDRDFDSIKTDL